jgi:uncharacterized membrane protein SirB2
MTSTIISVLPHIQDYLSIVSVLGCIKEAVFKCTTLLSSTDWLYKYLMQVLLGNRGNSVLVFLMHFSSIMFII